MKTGNFDKPLRTILFLTTLIGASAAVNSIFVSGYETPGRLGPDRRIQHDRLAR